MHHKHEEIYLLCKRYFQIGLNWFTRYLVYQYICGHVLSLKSILTMSCDMLLQYT